MTTPKATITVKVTVPAYNMRGLMEKAGEAADLVAEKIGTKAAPATIKSVQVSK